jgi:hypothetical protein
MEGAKKAVDVCGEAESRVDVLPDRARRRWVMPSASWRVEGHHFLAAQQQQSTSQLKMYPV